MKRPATATRKSSLLVDYSKSKASEKLNDLDLTVPGAHPTATAATPLRAKSLSYHARRASTTMTLAGLVQEGRQRNGSFCIKRDDSVRQPEVECDPDISESSFSLPELDPMSHSSSQDRKTRLLGASEDTLEAEGDDSFYQSSFSDMPTTSTMGLRSASSHGSSSPTAPANRRAQLQNTRRYQSMSSLSPPRERSQASSTTASTGGQVLSFSLRRRTSCRDMGNNNISTTTGTDNSCKAPLSRCKTWDHNNSTSLNRFHQSLSALNADNNNNNNNNAMDATEHNSNQTQQRQQQQPEATPAQNRRSRLVRHSSVSALQQQPKHASLDMGPASSHHQHHHGSGSIKRVFPLNTPRMLSGGAGGSPKSVVTNEILPNTIEIQPRRTSTRRRGSLGSDASSQQHEKQEKRNSGGGSSHGEKKKEKRRSSKNGPGALDRHLDRHSGRGSSRHLRGSEHSTGSRSSRRSSGKKSLPTLETDEMSFSSQSYFSSVSKCPSTRSAPMRGLAKTTPGASSSSSARRDTLKKTGGSSRRDLLANARGSVTSRRDLMQRQMSSRRNLGATTNMGKLSSCGVGQDGGPSMLMDDSSQFVTGSRIRRGRSCRQLLA